MSISKNWKEAIREGRKQGATVLMMVRAFNRDESTDFYDYLVYASEHGVEVLLVPEKEPKYKSHKVIAPKKHG